jgi:hypothetical protein
MDMPKKIIVLIYQPQKLLDQIYTRFSIAFVSEARLENSVTP